MKLNIYPVIRQKMSPYIQSTKVDISETVSFYKGNAAYGWERGRKLSKFQHRNPAVSFLIKTISTILNTKIRSKDITPLISCGLFSFTNPIPGAGVVGFALGKAANTKITKGCLFLKTAFAKIKLK